MNSKRGPDEKRLRRPRSSGISKLRWRENRRSREQLRRIPKNVLCSDATVREESAILKCADNNITPAKPTERHKNDESLPVNATLVSNTLNFSFFRPSFEDRLNLPKKDSVSGYESFVNCTTAEASDTLAVPSSSRYHEFSGGLNEAMDEELSSLSDLSISDCGGTGSQEHGLEGSSQNSTTSISSLESRKLMMPVSKVFYSKRFGNKMAFFYKNGIAILIPITSEVLKPPIELVTFPTLDLEKEFWKSGLRITQASPVFSIIPYDNNFKDFCNFLASLSLKVTPTSHFQLFILFTTNPNFVLDNSPRNWQIIDKSQVKYDEENCKASFTFNQFCSFVAIIREQPPTEEIFFDRVKDLEYQVFRSKYFPSIEVLFPLEPGLESCQITVFSDSEVPFEDCLRKQSLPQSPATPVIKVVPKTKNILESPAVIQLPIPDYDLITKHFGNHARLNILSNHDLSLQWETVNVAFKVRKLRETKNEYVIEFPVHHFSCYRVVWTILWSWMVQFDLGMKNFFQSVSMKCIANMDDYPEHRRFGLEIICFRSSKELPEIQNYKVRVGQSLPKPMKPGKILVNLRGQCFEPDEEVGEDKNLVKEESCFNGKDFAKHFACRYKGKRSMKSGTFGKVIVSRKFDELCETIFEFNVHRKDSEPERCDSYFNGDRWSYLAYHELAKMFHMTASENLKLLAQNLGFGKEEIETFLRDSPDPFYQIFWLYRSRGGDPDDLVSTIYGTYRQAKNEFQTTPSGTKCQMECNFSQVNEELMDLSKDSKVSIPPYTCACSFEVHDQGCENEPKTPRKKSMCAFMSSPTKCTRSSTEVLLSSDTPIDQPDNSQREAGMNPHSENIESDGHLRRDRSMLDDEFLWKVSNNLGIPLWKGIGRSLGLDETVLMNVEQQYKSCSLRECAYHMLKEWKQRKPKMCCFGQLYQTLCDEGLNSIASLMISTKSGSSSR